MSNYAHTKENTMNTQEMRSAVRAARQKCRDISRQLDDIVVDSSDPAIRAHRASVQAEYDEAEAIFVQLKKEEIAQNK
jgi:hypothetical protein